MAGKWNVPQWLEGGSHYNDPKGNLTEWAKSDLFATMSKEFGWREFGDHDLTQVQESLKAEGKNPNDLKIVHIDMQDYARKTGWEIWWKVEEWDMAMAA